MTIKEILMDPRLWKVSGQYSSLVHSLSHTHCPYPCARPDSAGRPVTRLFGRPAARQVVQSAGPVSRRESAGSPARTFGWSAGSPARPLDSAARPVARSLAHPLARSSACPLIRAPARPLGSV